jgi:hypothetical protein
VGAAISARSDESIELRRDDGGRLTLAIAPRTL